MTSDTNITIALLDAIWRVFKETGLAQIPSDELRGNDQKNG